MAVGALERLGGDVAVAVSGVAGPDGGTPDKPVGTVWFAWGRRDAQGTMVRTALERFPGDRDAVRRQAVERALRGVLERVSRPLRRADGARRRRFADGCSSRSGRIPGCVSR